MNSLHSDTESNVSGFIRYSNEDIKRLYSLVLKNMQMVNEDVLVVEKNLQNIVSQSGHMEKQLTALVKTLPQPNVNLSL